MIITGTFRRHRKILILFRYEIPVKFSFLHPILEYFVSCNGVFWQILLNIDTLMEFFERGLLKIDPVLEFGGRLIPKLESKVEKATQINGTSP